MNPKTKMTAPLQQKMVRGNSNNNVVVHKVTDNNQPSWQEIAKHGTIVNNETLKYYTDHKRKT